MNINNKYLGFKKNNRKNGLLFQYNIIAGTLLGIGYVSDKTDAIYLFRMFKENSFFGI